jgi:hypothetical protein
MRIQAICADEAVQYLSVKELLSAEVSLSSKSAKAKTYDIVDIPQFLFNLLPRCYPARFLELRGTKGKPAISLRQRALFWLREPDLN